MRRHAGCRSSTTWASSASSSAPLFTTSRSCFLPTRASSRAPAHLARHDPRAPRHDHVRAELRVRARGQALARQGRRGPRSDRACASPAAAPSRSTPKTLRDFADAARAARLRPEAFLPAYGMAEATLAITLPSARHADASPTASTARRDAPGQGRRRPPRGEESLELCPAAPPSRTTRSAIVGEDGAAASAERAGRRDRHRAARA